MQQVVKLALLRIHLQQRPVFVWARGQSESGFVHGPGRFGRSFRAGGGPRFLGATLQFLVNRARDEGHQDMCLDPPSPAMVHRTDAQIRLRDSEGLPDMPELTVAFDRRFGWQPGVGQIPFQAIPLDGLVDLLPIDPHGHFPGQLEELVIATVIEALLDRTARSDAFPGSLQAVVPIVPGLPGALAGG